ncbi:endoplasmic reticulum metallopeptidase 1-like isoform X2 [Anthonomus grandis grandis]|uniref:endoplasmic reticulum metallopeptidase 1-like isoform X2 n=1 Tax=Anthonomus grandis grandis TaxID=2921223 RepID=UPI0021657E64|nr:endoplasmic reticulum metallopeptidase 1-like isoform X2 [Anthonomus grandis grandis]
MSTIRKRFATSEKHDAHHRSYNDVEATSKFEKPLPASHFMAILGLILLTFSLVIIIEKQLPKGLTIADEEQNPDSFIAERAYNILKNLTRIGPRVAGSYENEVLAVQVITEEIKNIISKSHPNHVVELDVQKASGAFNLEFLDGMTNVYQDVQNIVVKLDSPGASDDGAGCAVMLEILRALVQAKTILRHNIIFLFNGGEENFMPASHGFITQHKWAKEVRAFINLEACGAGGREVLFQAGPNHPWILETYSEEVPYPYASSLAQEIFQSGVVPGDTDYRIFRDFGNVSGLDFAWSANGYVYHTKFDSIQQVPLGSLQRTGDNILALAKGMAQGHQLSNSDQYRAGNLVFFDFLGAFVIRWPMAVADVINILSVIISLYTIYGNTKDAGRYDGVSSKIYLNKLTCCMGIILLSWALCVLFNLGTAAYLTGLGRTMSWYARPYWIFFLYVVPTLVISLVTILQHAKYYNKDLELSPWTVFQLYYDAYQSIWTIVLFIGIGLRIRSSFIALMWVAFASLGNILKSKLFGRWRGSKWIFLHIFTVGLPFVQHFYLTIGALYLFIPIMGRAGSGSHAEFLIAVMVSLMFALLFCFAVPLILLVRTVDRIFNFLVATFLISFGVLLLTPLGFPYSVSNGILAPQRFMIAHTQRIFHDQSGAIVNTSNGYWIVDMDINSPHTVDNYVPQMKTAHLIEKDKNECADYLYCGLPYLVPVLNMIWKTHWVPGPEPKLLKPVNMTVIERKTVNGLERIEFEISGPSHIGAIISPIIGIEIKNWSIPTPEPLAGPKWNGRDSYFVFYAYGLDPVPLRFWIDFKVPNGHTGSIMDFAVTSHYLFGDGKASRDLKDFINQFPDWSAISYWTASYESWIL